MSINELQDGIIEEFEAFDDWIDRYQLIIDYAKELNNPPEFLQKQRPWVQKVLGGTHHTPFAKVKTTFADLSGDGALLNGMNQLVRGDGGIKAALAELK